MTKPAVRVRKNVLTLGSAGDDLDWYAKAVAVLKARPLNDSTSWRYMAAVHGYPGFANDPFAQPGDKPPSKASQKLYWNQCQHQTWFFLPWHRGYLALFEEIVAAAVVAAGGPPGWALPYWNYSDPAPNSLALPAAFLDPTSPLWLSGRNMTSAADTIPPTHVVLSALSHSPFAGVSGGGDPGFGGVKTGFSHFGGTNGRLEALPHNQVHVDVGGLMGDPDTAALDPIFWLHHSNIDRLWEVWTHRDPSFLNPSKSAWLTGTPFHLHDAAGAVVKFTASQMRNTLTVRHGYKYDDITDPRGSAAPASFSRLRPSIAMTLPPTELPQNPELVGATAQPLPLANVPTVARVSFNAVARFTAVARVPGRSVRAYLNLENVTGSVGGRSYAVYVDAPKAATAAAATAATAATATASLLAGHLSTFGVRKASSRQDAHGGAGITTVLDISPLIEKLHRDRDWDGQVLDVTLVPEGPRSDLHEMDSGSLQVGRISVYYG